MAFREKLKKTFSRNQSSGNSENSSTLSKTNSKQNSRRNSKDNKNHQYYKPGEKIPQSKYRRPVDPAHKAQLESFSFAKAWRRMSNQSQYSPMGSRLPSRRGSVISSMRKSIGSRRGNSSIGPGPEDRDIVGSTLSRQVTAPDDESGDTPKRSKDFAEPTAALPNVAKHNTPFSQEDLNLALKRPHLEVPASAA